MAQSKAELYREALGKLGTEVTFADFCDYLKRNHKLKEEEIAQSAFYTEKRKILEAKGEAPPKRARKKRDEAEPATSNFSVSDLPVLMGQTKELLTKFGGDKESLAAFVKAL